MTALTTSSTRPALSLSPLTAGLAAIGAVFLVISPLGLGWLFLPAQAAAHIPATTLNYADLHHLSGSGAVPTTWDQKNYFAWLGWVLIVAVIVGTGAAVLARRRALSLGSVVLTVVAILLSLFAAKGALSWSQFFHEVPHLRIGAYLLVVGYLVMLASALLPDRD